MKELKYLKQVVTQQHKNDLRFRILYIPIHENTFTVVFHEHYIDIVTFIWWCILLLFFIINFLSVVAYTVDIVSTTSTPVHYWPYSYTFVIRWFIHELSDVEQVINKVKVFNGFMSYEFWRQQFLLIMWKNSYP